MDSVSKNHHEQNNKSLIVGIFNHGIEQVLNLDFSFLNLKFYEVNSPEFKKLVNEFNYSFPITVGNNISVQPDFPSTIYYHLQNERVGGFHPNLYALVPIDFTSIVTRDTFFDIETILLLLFPSDFQLDSLIHYEKESNDKYSESYTTHHDITSYSYLTTTKHEIFPCIKDHKILEINDALKLVYGFIKNSSNFEIAISSYVEAFKQKSAKMAYICYCIALEALVESNDGEVTYKICRTTAVINADNVTDGEVIFHNTKQFYNLRSRIIHGGSISFLTEYFFPLQALLSRTLLEIISLQIQDQKQLSKFVHQSGFGIKISSQNYKKLILNEDVEQLLIKPISKFKPK